MPSENGFDYAPADEQTHGVYGDQIQTPDDLQTWMQNRIAQYQNEIGQFTDIQPRGRIYVARSIGYYPDLGLTQTGSAPGFFGGVWTLCTCKKKMRREDTFKNHFEGPDDEGIWYPKYPVFIVTISSSDAQKHPNKPASADDFQPYIASIALITKGFQGMESIGNYLDQHFEGDAVRKRKTGVSNAPPLALNRGDVHVNGSNEVTLPPSNHQHGESDSPCECRTSHFNRDPLTHEDNKLNLVNCLSRPGFWTAWKEPTLVFTKENFTQGKLRLWGNYYDLIGHIESVNK